VSMSRPVKLERRAALPPTIAPFTEQTLGTIDPSGYSVSDVATDLQEYGYGGSEPASGGAGGGVAGAASTPEGLGVRELVGVWLGPQHAFKPVPLEYSGDISPEHVLSRLHSFTG